MASSLTFLMIGDWGGQPSSPYYTEAEKGVASAIGSYAQQNNVSFVAALGDNFYNTGVPNEHSSRFRDTFENVFAAPSLANMRFAAIGGNHDHYGNIDAQVAYTQDSQRWYFPSLWYNFSGPVGNTGLTFEILFIDTVVWAGMSYQNETTGEFVKPKGPASQKLADEQIEWLTQRLASSTADYLFVAGHYPIYSVCSHGNTQALVDQLLPLMAQYGAQAYFCGHDHCLEHFVDPATGVVMLLTGAGKECCYDPTNKGQVPAQSLKWYVASDNAGNIQGGWSSAVLNSAGAIFTFFDTLGNKLYQTPVVRPRHH